MRAQDSDEDEMRKIGALLFALAAVVACEDRDNDWDVPAEPSPQIVGLTGCGLRL